MGSGSTSFDPISSRNFTVTLGDPVKHSYTIAGTLEVKIQLCFDRQVAVNQAKVALESAENQLRSLKTQFAQASPTEKPGLRLEIEEFEQTVRDLQAQVDAAKAALQSCLDRFQHLHDLEVATDAVLVSR
jgi:chromosome segregation ATPase